MEILVTFFSAPSVDILLTRDTRDMLVQIGVYNIDIQLQQPLQKRTAAQNSLCRLFLWVWLDLHQDQTKVLGCFCLHLKYPLAVPQAQDLKH